MSLALALDLAFALAFAFAFADGFFAVVALQRPVLSARLPPLQVAASAGGSSAISPPASTTSILPSIFMAFVSCRYIADVAEFNKGRLEQIRGKRGELLAMTRQKHQMTTARRIAGADFFGFLRRGMAWLPAREHPEPA
ncbi:MAG: hypothetical protein IPL72_02145 [Sulfuritalea sp.]|nr:hypothetical protein [Sulfuritalea sp.]